MPIKTTKAGGYSILQAERLDDSARNERKIFVFLTDSIVDLAIYKQLGVPGNLNIYQAYYENCKYTYILEYFVETRNALSLQTQLKQPGVADVGVYKECIHIKNQQPSAEKGFYVWPTN